MDEMEERDNYWLCRIYVFSGEWKGHSIRNQYYRKVIHSSLENYRAIVKIKMNFQSILNYWVWKTLPIKLQGLIRLLTKKPKSEVPNFNLVPCLQSSYPCVGIKEFNFSWVKLVSRDYVQKFQILKSPFREDLYFIEPLGELYERRVSLWISRQN